MRASLIVFTFLTILSRSTHAQQPPKVAPCDSSTLSVAINGAEAGRERYRITCLPGGGYEATGHSTLELGGQSADYTVTMRLDSGAIPRLVVANGTTSAGPLSDTLHLHGDSTMLTRGSAAPQRIPAAPDASYLGNNLFWPISLLLARYDAARGGTQEIRAFPSVPVRITYAGADTIPAGEGESGASLFHRYTIAVALATISAWTDDAGRFVGIALPAARLTVMSTRYAAAAPALSARGGGAATAEAPDYSAPPGASFSAEEVRIDAGGGVTLAGTLLIPKGRRGPFPAAITITGSGQQTRDEAIPIAGLEKFAPFRQIAETLATRGIAVLRVDDRGAGASTGAATLDSATSTTFAGDVRAQLAFLRRRADIDGSRIALIGHSEGGLIAPMVAARDSAVAALVLMAGTALPGDSVLVEQMNAMLVSDTALSESERERSRSQQRETIAQLRRGESPPGLRGAGWLREFITYDPRVALAKVHQPVLILQGGRDQQVLPRHAQLLADALRRGGNERVTVREYPTLNHLFLPSRTGAVSEYGSLERQTLGAEVLGAIADFLTTTLRAGR